MDVEIHPGRWKCSSEIRKILSISRFVEYIDHEKNYSPYTVSAYQKDLIESNRKSKDQFVEVLLQLPAPNETDNGKPAQETPVIEAGKTGKRPLLGEGDSRGARWFF